MDVSTGKPKHPTQLCDTVWRHFRGWNQVLVGERASYKQWLEKRTGQSSSSLHWGPGTSLSMGWCKDWEVSP